MLNLTAANCWEFTGAVDSMVMPTVLVAPFASVKLAGLNVIFVFAGTVAAMRHLERAVGDVPDRARRS